MPEKPNVLIIYPDQMRYDCMGCTGNQVVKTPGFDRLFSESVSFNNAYTSFPLCCPFRASLFTGKYSTSHGMMANHYPVRLNQKFLPQIMSDNGYETFWVGKWHLNGGKKYDHVPKEYRLGFNHFVGFSRGHEYLTPVYYRDDDPTPYKSDMFEPDMQTGHLLELIDDSLKSGKPFFGAVGYGLPHESVDLAPDYYKRLYKPEEITPSPTVVSGQEERIKKFTAKYYGLVANVDYQVQRILNFLESRGALDDTAVILVSDHGDMCGEHGRMGKKIYYNSAMHVPFMIRYPALSEHKTQEQIVDPSVDIMPTVLQLCGIPIPDGVEGGSLVKLIKEGKDDSLPDYVLYQIPIEKEGPERHPDAERGLRTDSYMYSEKNRRGFVLFDLKHDPLEEHNLIDDPEYAPVIKALSEKLERAMEQIGDNWDAEIVFPPVNFQTHKDGIAYNKLVYGKAVYEDRYRRK